MYARVGVPSGIQDTTYHSNRESANELANVAFMSKGELIRMIRLIHSENIKLKAENRKIRDQILDYQRAELKALRGGDALMKVAI